MQSELLDYDATDSAQLIRRGEIRAVEILEEAISGIEELNTRINASFWAQWNSRQR